MRDMQRHSAEARWNGLTSKQRSAKIKALLALAKKKRTKTQELWRTLTVAFSVYNPAARARCGRGWGGWGENGCPGERGCRRADWVDNPTVNELLVVGIDRKHRPGALTGLVEAGQRYAVDKLSPTELRFRLLTVKEAAPSPARFEKRGPFTVGVCAPVSQDAINAALADFP